MQGAPKDIFPYVSDFCNNITSSFKPFFLTPTPAKGSEVGWCTEIVRSKVERDGGKPILGWRIWEWYGIMIEAEFHMIWESPSGEIFDLTPTPDNEESILFLRDDSLVYEDKQIDNIRKSLINNAEVDDFIQVNELIFKLMNKDKLTFQHGFIELSPKDSNRLKSLEIKKLKLYTSIKNSKPGRNEFCRCGSGKKSKKCCN